MQIAISSQNRQHVSPAMPVNAAISGSTHIVRGTVAGKRLIELPIDQSFHASHEQFAAPLADINVLITRWPGQWPLPAPQAPYRHPGHRHRRNRS